MILDMSFIYNFLPFKYLEVWFYKQFNQFVREAWGEGRDDQQQPQEQVQRDKCGEEEGQREAGAKESVPEAGVRKSKTV